jgi:hypothetical protein
VRFDFVTVATNRSGNERTRSSAIDLVKFLISPQPKAGLIGTTTCRPLPPVVFTND